MLHSEASISESSSLVALRGVGGIKKLFGLLSGSICLKSVLTLFWVCEVWTAQSAMF
jgi:predicted LPLAT superfamily acyltransferase